MSGVLPDLAAILVEAMTAASLSPPRLLRAARAWPLWRWLGRRVVTGVGYGLILVGAIGSVLPGHLGAPVLAVGLVLTLRSSFSARRRFVGLQQRHPRILFPVRRLLRREPEVAPVLWQAVLRAERALLPKRLRFASKLRRRWRR